MTFDNIGYNCNIPKFIDGLIDETKYKIAKINVEYEDDETNEQKYKTDYIIQKVGLGILG
jgi:hypothetical protein